MDALLMSELDTEISKEAELYYKQIVDQVYEIFLNAISKAVYNYYLPIDYKRTWQLLQCVYFETKNDGLYVYIDEKELEYISWVDGRYVSVAVPYFVNEGHDDGSAINNQFHHYEGRH
jgi:hypothetical protein